MKLKDKIIKLSEKMDNAFEYLEDLDTRSGYVCFNIKNHEFLSEDDLMTVLLDIGIDKPMIEDIGNEFNNERLWNIWHHTAEHEISWFREWIDGCAYNSYGYIYEKYVKPIQEDGSLSNQEKDEKIKEVWSQWENDSKCLDLLSKFDSKDVWQFGRSGGWLSLFKRSEINAHEENVLYTQDIASLIDDNYGLTNKKLIDIIDDEIGINELTMTELYSTICSESDGLFEFVEAVKFVEQHIKDCLQGFHSQCLEILREEVVQYVDQEGIIINVKNISVDKEWISGVKKHTNSLLALVRYDKNKDVIETSKGLSFSSDKFIKEFKNIGGFITEGVDIKFNNHKIFDKFYLSRIKCVNDDYLIKAGCHNMLYSNINNIYEEILTNKT